MRKILIEFKNKDKNLKVDISVVRMLFSGQNSWYINNIIRAKLSEFLTVLGVTDIWKFWRIKEKTNYAKYCELLLKIFRGVWRKLI